MSCGIKKVDGSTTTIVNQGTGDALVVVQNPKPIIVTKDGCDAVKIVDCEKTVLKVSYRGPQGPKGDSFDDFIIPSLAERFENGLL